MRDLLRNILKRVGLLNIARKAVAMKNRSATYLKSKNLAFKAYREEKKDEFCLKGISGASLKKVKGYISEIRSNDAFNKHIKNCLEYLGKSAVSAIEKPEYIYVLCRLMKPEVIVETGVASGISSAYILCALNNNARGTLHSVDKPNYEDELIVKCQDYKKQNLSVPPAHLPEGKSCGWVVSEDLRKRWVLKIGLTREVLKPLLERLGSIDIFLHDSEHSYENMLNEFKTAWPFLKKGGLLVAHDIRWNNAFFEFVQSVDRKYHILFPASWGGGIGVIRK